MSDRELARAAHDSDAWLRDTVAAIDTPEFRESEVALASALSDERERITRKIIARWRESEDE